MRLLILGGTTEASALARAVAARSDIAPLLSFAGRTEAPVAPPISYRVGGFGGVAGLTAFLEAGAFDAVVDATHPFAARMSVHAVAACRQAGVRLVRFDRPPWLEAEGDRWHHVPDFEAAAAALAMGGIFGDEASRRVFLTTGRLDLTCFRAASAHRYLIRTIDPPDPSQLPLHATVIQARPPFTIEGEVALMRDRGIDLLVSKNSGGAAASAKLTAARALSVPVLMIDRPTPSEALTLHDLNALLTWIVAGPASALPGDKPP